MNLIGVYLSIANAIIMFINFALSPSSFYGKFAPVFILTKPLIVQFILLHLYLNLESIPKEIYYWCGFCFLGDIILLFRSVVANKVGCISFFFSQVIISRFYEVNWSFDLMKTPFFLALVLPSAILLLIILYPKALKIKPIYTDGIVYLLSLVVALAASTLRSEMYDPKSPEFLSSYLGHLFFVISDYFLINATICDTTDRFNIIVLPTYIIALLGISTGVILSLNKIQE